jgi:hypothetical protein
MSIKFMSLVLISLLSSKALGDSVENYKQRKKDFERRLLAEKRSETRSDKFYLEWEYFTATAIENCGLITQLVQNHSKVTSVHFGNGSYYISIAPTIDSFLVVHDACNKKGYSIKLISQ